MEGQGVRVIPEVTSSSGETGEEEEDREIAAFTSPHKRVRTETTAARQPRFSFAVNDAADSARKPIRISYPASPLDTPDRIVAGAASHGEWSSLSNETMELTGGRPAMVEADISDHDRPICDGDSRPNCSVPENEWLLESELSRGTRSFRLEQQLLKARQERKAELVDQLSRSRCERLTRQKRELDGAIRGDTARGFGSIPSKQGKSFKELPM
jgi:hypothetical protein